MMLWLLQCHLIRGCDSGLRVECLCCQWPTDESSRGTAAYLITQAVPAGCQDGRREKAPGTNCFSFSSRSVSLRSLGNQRRLAVAVVDPKDERFDCGLENSFDAFTLEVLTLPSETKPPIVLPFYRRSPDPSSNKSPL